MEAHVSVQFDLSLARNSHLYCNHVSVNHFEHYMKAMLTQLILIIFLFSPALSYGQVCNSGDKSSLLGFLANLSTSSHPSLNWSSLTNCCVWEGVCCDTSGRVTHLQLPSRGLEGKITSSIGNLVRLTHLNLSNNHLHGTIGDKIGSLANLQIMDLSLNSFHGSISQEIGNLLYLQKLHLDQNKFRGPIPSSLMNCSNLVEIILRVNQLDGDISKLDFSKLAHLRKLDLGLNKLIGTIPESIYSCKSLVAIRVSANNLTGQISPKVIGLKSLSFICLGYNFFSNITMTLQVLARCRNLTTVILSSNFYGEPLPVHSNFIGSHEFPKLQYLELKGCNFGGPFPKWMSKLKSLYHLSLDGNQMIGRLPDWLGTLPNLMTLQLTFNSFSGNFPLKLCSLPALISQKTDKNLNLLRFELPIVIVSRRNGLVLTSNFDPFFFRLDLSYNRFSGNIPLEIGKLQNIIELALSHNNFSGHIPMELSKLKNLERLYLHNNHLTGKIPASLVSLYFLSVFDVSYNNLKGPIPRHPKVKLCGVPLSHPCTKASKGQVVVHNPDHISRGKMQHFLNGIFVGFAFGFSGVAATSVKHLLK